MAVRKRGNSYSLRIRPFGEEIGISTPAKTKQEAKRIEMALMTACRSGDYRGLDPVSREICIRLFKNKGWSIPSGLGPEEPVAEELTLWKSVEIFLKYPEIRASSERSRYEQCIVHLVEHFGKEQPVKAIWVPDVKGYMADRLAAGVAPSTANREKGTLSKVMQVLIEMRLLEANPCRLIKNLSQKSEERQVYLAFEDFERIAELAPDWFRLIMEMAFYTGMRRGEILGLKRGQVNLSRRIIRLGPGDTKY